MTRIEIAEVLLQLRIGVHGKIHLPHPAIVAQEGHHRRGAIQFGGQRRAGQRQRAALRAAGGAHAGLVHLVHGHDDARHLRRVEEHAAVIEPVRAVLVQSADDLTVQRVAAHRREILGRAALTAAVHGRGGKASRRPVEQSGKRAAAAGIAVINAHGGQPALPAGGADVAAVNFRAAHAGKVHLKALHAGGLKRGGLERAARSQRLHLGHGAIPERVDIGGALVASLIAVQFLQGHIHNRHNSSSFAFCMRLLLLYRTIAALKRGKTVEAKKIAPVRFPEPARTKNQNSRLPLNTSVIRQTTPLTCSRSSVRWAWWMSIWR